MKRPDPYVLARFLERIHERPGLSRSALQRAVGVNYDVLRNYLAFMEARAWIVDADGIHLTRAGEGVRRDTLDWFASLFDDLPL